MSNPVNAFLAVKRFTSDWDYVVQTYIRNNTTEGRMLLNLIHNFLCIIHYLSSMISGISSSKFSRELYDK